MITLNKCRFICELTEAEESKLGDLGGKAVNLARMIARDLPVPPGFVITSKAYEYFIRKNDLQDRITEYMKKIDGQTTSNKIEEISNQIKKEMQSASMPACLKEGIDRIYEKNELDFKVPMAVRSSATAEDMPESSFAGQYDTYLNIRGRERLLEAIKKCWASLWNARAISYRLEKRINSDEISQAVIVQQQIDADRAGVLFTANPLNGRRDRMLITASWGLGESVVSGDVNPDRYIVERPGGETVEINVNRKEVMTVRKENGVETVEVPPSRQKEQVLSESELKNLMDYGEELEELFAVPQDVEWGISNNEIYLLQSRPITSLFPLPEKSTLEGNDYKIYMNFNIFSQAMKEPFTPLGEALIMVMMKILNEFMWRNSQGKIPGWYKYAGGRVFFDMTKILPYQIILNNLEENPADKDPKTTEILLEVAKKNKEKLSEIKLSGGQLVKYLLKNLNPGLIKLTLSFIRKYRYARKHPDRAREKILQLEEDFLAELSEKRNQLNGREERLKLIEKSMTWFMKTSLMQIAYATPSSTYLEKVEAVLEKHNLETDILNDVEKWLPHSVTTEMGVDLQKTARKISEEDKELSTDAEEIEEFLGKYGHRKSIELDVGIPTWAEDPKYVLDLIRSYIDNDSYRSGLKEYHSGRQEAEKAIDEIRKKLENEAGFKTAKKAEKMLLDFRKLFGMRERFKFFLLRTFKVYREMMLEIAREMQEEGNIDEVEDIFFLKFSEIIDKKEKRQELVQKRKQEYSRNSRINAPRVMMSTGESIYYSDSKTGDGDLQGIGVSAGIAEGPVKILHDPEEGSSLKSGDILVTKGVNPSWTPLFLTIEGLIMETGGPISHGSVVAREYGIPSVAGVDRATEKLKENQIVRVNGEKGTIEIVKN